MKKSIESTKFSSFFTLQAGWVIHTLHHFATQLILSSLFQECQGYEGLRWLLLP
ncbi:hypothetical protein ACH0BF_24150 [Pseudobacillus sp. 179-B 2D1 NHS]|uniref:hypothetical protein n=1 Tax=Pseudobacillus sp. 179-B 2D1 NHS TaxID=3374292 RepID=UPI00387A7E81